MDRDYRLPLGKLKVLSLPNGQAGSYMVEIHVWLVHDVAAGWAGW
jgi:hypothetical protein